MKTRRWLPSEQSFASKVYGLAGSVPLGTRIAGWRRGVHRCEQRPVVSRVSGGIVQEWRKIGRDRCGDWCNAGSMRVAIGSDFGRQRCVNFGNARGFSPLGLHFATNILPKPPGESVLGNLDSTLRGDWIFELSMKLPPGVFEWEVCVTGVRDKGPLAPKPPNPPTRPLLTRNLH
jgi:hypothetical protein